MDPKHKKYLLVVAGPTASGKTALAIQLAQHFNTEIISADSRQFYNEMPIGTAAPTTFELSQVKHHFVGNISIRERFDVAMFEKQAIRQINSLFENHDIVIMVGGSGLFINAVCNGLDELPETTLKIRNEVQQIYQAEGLSGLQNRLKVLDPEYFESMDKQNPRRLQRALEVCLQTGKTFTSLRTNPKKLRSFQIIRIAIEVERKELIYRINKRVDNMMENGLADEVKSLIEYKSENALNTVGYKELFAYFDGKLTLEQAIEKIKTNTRRYAKRQMTWLRKNDDYTWFKSDSFTLITTYIKQKTGLEK